VGRLVSCSLQLICTSSRYLSCIQSNLDILTRPLYTYFRFTHYSF
jgi:hypothetical protein